MAPLSFADAASFPTFQQLPTTEEDEAPAPAAKWWLLALVKENMTITKPTLVVSDRVGVDFAVIFEDALDLKPWRKGALLVLPGARRTENRDAGRRPLVRVPAGEADEARVVLGGWDALQLWQEQKLRDGSQCAAECGKAGESRCLGCGVVKYCGKECQVQGWTDGHKKECKGFKSIKELWGEDCT